MTTQNYPMYRLEYEYPPPDNASDGAKKHWFRLMPIIFELQTARPADLPVLELLCELLADISLLQETIRADGIMIEAGSGGHKAHPAQKALEAARRQAHRLLDEFGLTPGSKAYRVDKYEEGPHEYRYG